MGIFDVEGHVVQTIAIRQCNMLCMGPRCMIMNHYIGLGSWQWNHYHTHKATLDGADLCMVWYTSQDGDIRCWGSRRSIHAYPVMQYDSYGSHIYTNTIVYWAWAMAMVPYTQSHPIQSWFLYDERCKSWWGYPVLRVLHDKTLLSGVGTYLLWVPDGWQ